MNVGRHTGEITAQCGGVQVGNNTAAGNDNQVTDILLLAGITFFGAKYLQINVAAAPVADFDAPGIGITVKTTQGEDEA